MAAAAAAMKTAPALHFIVSSMPPTSGPTIEPTRPIPSAQPTPVALTAGGEKPAASALAVFWPETTQKPAAKIAIVTNTTEWPSWPIAPTAKTAIKYTSASARNEKRSIMLPSAKVPTTPPTCNIDPIAAEDATEEPRSLRTVGSQFDRK